MQKAGCVLKNEKSEKKDPEAFIRNNQDKMRFGSFHKYAGILLRKQTFGIPYFDGLFIY